MANRPKIEFELNKATELELLYDKPVEGDGQYGHYQIYAVRRLEDKSEFSWFAPEAIHKQIQEKGLGKGDKFIITKEAKDINGKLVNNYKISFAGQSLQLEESNAPVKQEQEASSNKKYQAMDLAIKYAQLKSDKSIVIDSEELQKIADKFNKLI